MNRPYLTQNQSAIVDDAELAVREWTADGIQRDINFIKSRNGDELDIADRWEQLIFLTVLKELI